MADVLLAGDFDKSSSSNHSSTFESRLISYYIGRVRIIDILKNIW
jgi:hypothetical protein